MIKLEFTGQTPEDLTTKVRDYVKGLKGTRGGKNDDEGAQTGGGQTAPPPLVPPAGGVQGFNPGGSAGFALPGQGAGPGGAFPAPGATFGGPDHPAIAALAQQVVVRLDGSIASGQPPDKALEWFRNQLGPNAAGYTLDQCKQALLQCSLPMLQNIAKLMGIQVA